MQQLTRSISYPAQTKGTNTQIATQLIKTYTAIERAYKTATSYENNKINRGVRKELP